MRVLEVKTMLIPTFFNAVLFPVESDLIEKGQDLSTYLSHGRTWPFFSCFCTAVPPFPSFPFPSSFPAALVPLRNPAEDSQGRQWLFLVRPRFQSPPPSSFPLPPLLSSRHEMDMCPASSRIILTPVPFGEAIVGDCHPLSFFFRSGAALFRFYSFSPPPLLSISWRLRTVYTERRKALTHFNWERAR